MEDSTVPKLVQDSLLDGESVLYVATQSRLKHLLTPASLIATTHRLIRVAPAALGFKADMRDWLYRDVANIVVNADFLLAKVVIHPRYGKIEHVEKLPKSDAVELARTAMGRVRELSAGTSASKPVTSEPAEDPLEVAKLRLARGEIDKAEYESLIATLKEST